jgi:hypothetical protein
MIPHVGALGQDATAGRPPPTAMGNESRNISKSNPFDVSREWFGTNPIVSKRSIDENTNPKADGTLEPHQFKDIKLYKTFSSLQNSWFG